MATTPKPKVLLFDVGGVCVVSPFQAILDYETERGIPNGYINYSISASKPNGSWHKLERGEVPLDDSWFRAWKADIENPKVWERFHREKLAHKGPVPPSPNVDAEGLHFTMMDISREPDRYMAPALRKMKAAGWHLAALSNTTIFPEGHPLNAKRSDDIRDVFEVFVSSAHVGMRKPNRDIYDYTMKQLQQKWPELNIKPKDVVFFDDIGENLKMGKEVGWTTVKVWLGKTDDAVRELEKITGMQLLEEKVARARL